MGTVVQLKRSETTGSAPTASDIAVGELAINLADAVLYSKKTDGTIIEIGSNAALPDGYYLSTNQDFGSITVASTLTLDLGDLETETSSYDSGDLGVLTALSSPPASSTDVGSVGTITWDANYLYVCIATNTWKRVALSSW